MRRRLSYANVTATLALVLAMSGGALAAGHYLINSTHQINPKVLKKLRGARGAAGLRGATGLTGSQGKTGATGTAGKNGTNGTSGTSPILATAFVESTFSSPIELEATSKRVLTEQEGKTLHLTSAPSAHVLVQATLQIVLSGAGGSEVSCRLAHEVTPGGSTEEFGRAALQALPAASGTRSDELDLTGDVTLLGGHVYDLQVYCKAEGIGPTVTVTGGSLNAIATTE